jgi:hypothetical protein
MALIEVDGQSMEVQGVTSIKKETRDKGISEGREEPDDPGGVLMIKWSWRREAKTFEPRRIINPRLLVLETAKEILEEVLR